MKVAGAEDVGPFCNPSFKFSSLIFVRDQDTCPGHPRRHISLTLTAASAASLVSPGMFLPGRCALCVCVCVRALVCVSTANARRRPRLSFSLPVQCRVPALAFSLFGPFFLLLVCSAEPLSQRRSLSVPIYLMHNCPPLLSFYLFPSISIRYLFFSFRSPINNCSALRLLPSSLFCVHLAPAALFMVISQLFAPQHGTIPLFFFFCAQNAPLPTQYVKRSNHVGVMHEEG